MTDTEALVPASIVGFRQFRMGEDGSLTPLFVRASEAWVPGITEAACADNQAHRPPVAGCSCGLHAWYQPDDAIVRDERGLVTAAIRAHGRIVLAEHGFRAESAEIAAVCLPSLWTTPRRRRTEMAEEIRAHYPRALLLDSVRELRRHYPPDDLTALGVRSRPTSQARNRRVFHWAWVLGIVVFYSAILWPRAADSFITGGGWVVLLLLFVGWQALLLVRSDLDRE